MNTIELKKFLDQNNNKKIIMKVCAIDQLPAKLIKNGEYGFVINLSRSSEAGSHWVGLYIKDSAATYLDSYAFQPKSFYINDFIKKNCITFEYNKQQLQQLNSTVCGMYASLFILHMMNGGTLKTFNNRFSKNLVFNDVVIERMFKFNKKC